jgi:phospholipid/cholesterol/gamma-HCH transport system permease protein
MTTPTRTAPGRARSFGSPLTPVIDQLVWLGQMLLFCVEAVITVPSTLVRHPREVLRLLAEIAFGRGLLTVAASTVFVSAFLSAVIGIQIGLEGLEGLNVVGLEPLAGLLAAFGTTRELAPLIAAFGLAAQMGSRFTAQLGAMRINGEIDALETMAVSAMKFLVTTRLIAVSVIVVPMYLLALGGAYVASQLTVIFIAGQGSGTYQHYFDLFLNPRDVYFSIIKVVVMAILITFIHCYYGMTASGGPEGVGRATGRAIRASIVMIAIANMLMTLAFFGLDTGVKVAG